MIERRFVRSSAPIQDEQPESNLGSRESIKTQIKMMILKDTSIPTKKIIENLVKRGVAPSAFTVESIRADTRHTLKLLKSRGLLDIDI